MRVVRSCRLAKTSGARNLPTPSFGQVALPQPYSCTTACCVTGCRLHTARALVRQHIERAAWGRWGQLYMLGGEGMESRHTLC